jgi:hypothetical protein
MLLPQVYECKLAAELSPSEIQSVKSHHNTVEIQLYGLNLLPDFFKSLSVQLSLTNDDKAGED